jgi:uncharacterized membrane protein
MGSDWETIEERLASHSEARRGKLARRDRRRAWLPWILCPLVLPAIGAAVFLWLLEDAGGEFDGRSSGTVIATVAACWAVPALLAAVVARRQGVFEAIVWALVCAFVQLAFVVGIGFVALGLGPS